jgi:two-component system, cell cycle response regulator DivK
MEPVCLSQLRRSRFLTNRTTFFKNEILKRVLLVQDDKYMLDILASMLRFSGYDAVEAKSGGEAIEKAASVQPGLILLDLNLPGLDAAQSIRRNKRSDHICILAVALLAEQSARKLWGQGRLSAKTFSARTLKAKVEFILRSPDNPRAPM